jgi:hypothetical protein
MNTIKKLKVKLSAYQVAFTFLGLLTLLGGAVGLTQAFDSGTSPKVVVEGNYIEASESEQEEVLLGASNVTDFVSNYECFNGDCTYHLVQPFQTGTTTIVSLVNPYVVPTSSPNDVVITDTVNGFGYTGATSTVEMVRLTITGAATTTYGVVCAAAQTPFATTTATFAAINTPYSVSTTLGRSTVIETGTVSTTSGSIDPVNYNGSITSYISKIMVTPAAPYLICKVSGANNDAFTNPVRSFDGKVTVRWSRQR